MSNDSTQQAPYITIYEWDTPHGIHRSFSPGNWNGWEPTRAVRLVEATQPEPIDMVLYCPKCGKQHVDAPDTEPCKDGCQMAKDYGFSPSEGHSCSNGCGYMQEGSPRWTNPPHRSHLCHHCGCIWRPADVPTNGVANITTQGKADTWFGGWSGRAVAAKGTQPTDSGMPSEEYVGQLEYRGNSVAYIHQKLTAYRSAIDAAWQAMRDEGRGPDGYTELSDAIRAALATQQAEAQGIPDCGEAGHTEGRCGNASCMKRTLATQQAVPERLAKSLRGRGFRVPETLDEAIKSVAETIAEDGFIIAWKDRKLEALQQQAVQGEPVTPQEWSIRSFRDGDNGPWWIDIKAPGLGSFTKQCTKDNEVRMALALAATPPAPGQVEPADVCTDPDNCQRCKAPSWDKHNHRHAGISSANIRAPGRVERDREDEPTAEELEAFRRKHWMHWNSAENLLIAHLVAKLRCAARSSERGGK